MPVGGCAVWADHVWNSTRVELVFVMDLRHGVGGQGGGMFSCEGRGKGEEASQLGREGVRVMAPSNAPVADARLTFIRLKRLHSQLGDEIVVAFPLTMMGEINTPGKNNYGELSDVMCSLSTIPVYVNYCLVYDETHEDGCDAWKIDVELSSRTEKEMCHRFSKIDDRHH